LGDRAREENQGLFHINYKGDGPTEVTNLHGTPCRYLTSKDTQAFFYFAIENSFKTALKDVDIEVECFATNQVALNVDFDARKRRDISHSAYVQAGGKQLEKSTNWQTVVFHVRNATFANSQNGDADFRIFVRPPQIFIRRVTLIRQGSSTPPESSNH